MMLVRMMMLTMAMVMMLVTMMMTMMLVTVLVLMRIYHQLLPRSFVKGSFQFSNSLLLSFDDVYARPRHVITGIWAQGRGVAGQRGGQLLHGEAELRGGDRLLRQPHQHREARGGRGGVPGHGADGDDGALRGLDADRRPDELTFGTSAGRLGARQLRGLGVRGGELRLQRGLGQQDLLRGLLGR